MAEPCGRGRGRGLGTPGGRGRGLVACDFAMRESPLQVVQQAYLRKSTRATRGSATDKRNAASMGAMSRERAGREPPSWTPAVAIACIPVMISCAWAFGSIETKWALAAIFLGLFLFLFLVAIWAAPATPRGVLQALALGALGAAVLTAALLAFTQFAEDLDPKEPATTSGPDGTH